tara:strand:+ start:13616 stop:14800 length:1185 start_codon:yes stop_codon:yes gene_type:complete
MKANHLKPFGVVIFSLLAIASCSSNTSTENKNSNLEGSYELVKVDSLMVPVLEPLQITDFNADTEKFLALGIQSKNTMEIDFEGNVTNKVDLTGEGPGHFGNGLTELGYWQDGMIIYGPNVYFTYDKEWNYTGRILDNAGGFSLPLGFISGAPITLSKEGYPIVVKPTPHSQMGFRELPNDYFATAQLIELVSGSNLEIEGLLEFPENSVYKSQTTYYSSNEARLSADGDKLYLALPLEPKLYVYDMRNDFSLLETINLDLPRFRKPQGIPFEDQHKNGLSGFGKSNQLNVVYEITNSLIYSISAKGDLVIVDYKTGLEEETNASTMQEAWAKTKTGSMELTVFFKQGEKILEVEERFTKIVQISSTKFLAHYINEEEELDYNKFYIYELKKVK